MLAGVSIILVNGIKWFPVLFLLPIINIFLLIGVASYRPNYHKFVTIFTILGLFQLIGNIWGEQFEPLILIDLTIGAGLIGLGFYLNLKLFPDYSIVKEHYQDSQGKHNVRDAIKFEE
jgi:hypothetical protein